MVKKKRKVTKKTNSKKVLKSSKGYVKKISAVQKKNIKNKTYELPLNAFLKSVVKFIQVLSLSTSKIILSFLNKIIKAPFLFINIFFSIILSMFKNAFAVIYSLIKEILKGLIKFKEVIWGIFFGIISGGIGAILAVSYIELSSTNKDSFEKSEIYESILSKFELLEKKVSQIKLENQYNQEALEKLKSLEKEIYKAGEKYLNLENDFIELSSSLQKIEKNTLNLETGLITIKEDLKSSSKLILSSSKSELTNRLYLAQSLLDRLESGVPYAPQLEKLGKEGLDPALYRFAAGGAPTLKDLEARLSARAGEQLDADRTKRDNSWRENLKREISKYVKIKPTNINDIKGVTGALLRAEQSISRGDLAKAIREISSVPISERGPLAAWLTEATARQNADIAAKNLLAKTTAALKQKN